MPAFAGKCPITIRRNTVDVNKGSNHPIILAIDDNPLILDGYVGLLREKGYEVLTALTHQSALTIIEKINRPVIILLDWWHNDKEGKRISAAKLPSELTPLSRFPPLIIVITTDDSIAAEQAAIAAGATWFLPKARIELLADNVDRAVNHFRTIMQLWSDPVTKALKRDPMYEAMVGELTRAFRSKASIACVMFDLNKFKPINDTYGHDIGDAVLCSVNESLRLNIRSHIDILCRYGGDEFVVFLINITESEVRRFIEKACKAIAVNKVITTNKDGLEVGVGVTSSAGFSMITHEDIIARLSYQNSSTEHPNREEQVRAFFGLINDAIKKADTKMFAEKERNKSTGVKK